MIISPKGNIHPVNSKQVVGLEVVWGGLGWSGSPKQREALCGASKGLPASISYIFFSLTGLRNVSAVFYLPHLSVIGLSLEKLGVLFKLNLPQLSVIGRSLLKIWLEKTALTLRIAVLVII